MIMISDYISQFFIIPIDCSTSTILVVSRVWDADGSGTCNSIGNIGVISS